MNNNWNDTAEEQARYGNTVPSRSEPKSLKFTPRTNYVPQAERKPNRQLPEYGHMVFLKKLSESEQEVIVITSLGQVARGQIKAVDEQTISLKCQNTDGEGYRTRVLFKSQIVEFSPVKGIEALADELSKKGTVSTDGSIFKGFGGGSFIPS